MRQYISNTVTRLRPRRTSSVPAPAETSPELPHVEVRLHPYRARSWAEKVAFAERDLAQASMALDIAAFYPGRRR
jgi:hypothetical protein